MQEEEFFVLAELSACVCVCVTRKDVVMADDDDEEDRFVKL